MQDAKFSLTIQYFTTKNQRAKLYCKTDGHKISLQPVAIKCNLKLSERVSLTD